MNEYRNERVQPGHEHLLDVAMEQLNIHGIEYSDREIPELRIILSHFVSNLVSYIQSRGVFLNVIGSDLPISYVKRILSIPINSPPFAAPEIKYEIIKPKRRPARPWSNDEDNRLICAIYHFGSYGWERIASFVGNGRTCEQCLQRWKRTLKPGAIRGKFSPEEDNKLITLVKI